MAAGSHEVVNATERLGEGLAWAVVDGLELPVVVCDLGRRIALANAAARALWGHPGELESGGVGLEYVCFADDHGRMLAGGCHPLARGARG